MTLIVSCSYGDKENYYCEANQEIVEIDFTLSRNFNSAILNIDGIKFKHSYYLDTINSGNYLPREKVIFFTVENRDAEERTTKILIASTLARKLKITGNYTILNGPQILTQGILKFKRKDGKKIFVTTSKKYPASINGIYCD